MEIRIGKVTHYFDQIGVAVLWLSEGLSVGEQICIIGRNTDFNQEVRSMEINHVSVQQVGPCTEVALKVLSPVHPGDNVFRVADEK
jgi:hypothetical protein